MDKRELVDELVYLETWFMNYDLQISQYQRCVRLGDEYDKDITALDIEAKTKQQRIRELRKLLDGDNE